MFAYLPDDFVIIRPTIKIVCGVKLINRAKKLLLDQLLFISPGVAETQLHSTYNRVELSRVFLLWGLNASPIFCFLDFSVTFLSIE